MGSTPSNLADLETLLTLCRKHGVAQIKHGDTHIVLEPRAFLTPPQESAPVSEPPLTTAPKAKAPVNPMMPTTDDLSVLLHGAR